MAPLARVDLTGVTALHLGGEPVEIVSGSLALFGTLEVGGADGGAQRLPGSGPFYVASTPNGERILGALVDVQAFREAAVPTSPNQTTPGGSLDAE